MEVERGKLIFKHSEFATLQSKIFTLIFTIVILVLIPWVWITFEGNINPLTWNGEEWLVAILSSFIAIVLVISAIFEVLGSQPLKIYENGFCPMNIPLKYGVRRKEVFIPWEDVVYIEYEIPSDFIGDPSKPLKKYKIYYKLNGKVWCQRIINYNILSWRGEEFERKVFGKLYEVYTKLKNEGKLLPEKPKKVKRTFY